MVDMCEAGVTDYNHTWFREIERALLTEKGELRFAPFDAKLESLVSCTYLFKMAVGATIILAELSRLKEPSYPVNHSSLNSHIPCTLTLDVSVSEIGSPLTLGRSSARISFLF